VAAESLRVGAPPAPAGRSSRRRLGQGAAGPLSLLTGVGIWELAGRLFQADWLPPFSTVVERLVELIQLGLIPVNLLDSLQAMLIGFAVSLVVSLVFGGLMAWYPVVDRALGVYVYAFFVLPSITLAPVFLALFGATNATRLGVIITSSVFLMIQNFRTAFHRPDEGELVEMAQSYGARGRDVARFVILPAAWPMVFATIRLGLGRSLKGMINGEQFIAVYGLGGLVQRYGSQFDSRSVLAILLVIVVIAVALDWVVRAIDRRVTRWAEP
jgi:ABC-type nitrate/sulfonate/bicarbonate transport system permease component